MGRTGDTCTSARTTRGSRSLEGTATLSSPAGVCLNVLLHYSTSHIISYVRKHNSVSLTLEPCCETHSFSTALYHSHFLAQHLNRVAKRIRFFSPPPAIISFSYCTVTAAMPSYGTSERARRCGRSAATDGSSTVWRATRTTPSWLPVASTTQSNYGPHARHRPGRKGGGRGTPRACPTKPATDPHWRPMSIHWRRCLNGTQPH